MRVLQYLECHESGAGINKTLAFKCEVTLMEWPLSFLFFFLYILQLRTKRMENEYDLDLHKKMRDS
jgi:hypothetical protein